MADAGTFVKATRMKAAAINQLDEEVFPIIFTVLGTLPNAIIL